MAFSSYCVALSQNEYSQAWAQNSKLKFHTKYRIMWQPHGWTRWNLRNKLHIKECILARIQIQESGFLSSMDARILLASFVKDMTFFNFLPLTLIVSTWFTDSSYSEITIDSPDYTVKNKTSQVLGSIKPNNNTSSYILIL